MSKSSTRCGKGFRAALERLILSVIWGQKKMTETARVVYDVVAEQDDNGWDIFISHRGNHVGTTAARTRAEVSDRASDYLQWLLPLVQPFSLVIDYKSKMGNEVTESIESSSTIEVELPDDVFLTLAKAAHVENKTLNEFLVGVVTKKVNEARTEALRPLKEALETLLYRVDVQNKYFSDITMAVLDAYRPVKDLL